MPAPSWPGHWQRALGEGRPRRKGRAARTGAWGWGKSKGEGEGAEEHGGLRVTCIETLGWGYELGEDEPQDIR